MFTVVLIVLLLTGRAVSYTFTGGAENGSFTCHCEPDVQCNDNSGWCPGGGCDSNGPVHWQGTACQATNVALLGGTADQTGDADHDAGRCIKSSSNTDITQESCCNPRRANGELSWTVDLGGTFAISYVDIHSAADDLYRHTITGLEVFIFTNETWTDAERCGILNGNIQGSIRLYCSRIMLGRYVTIRQPNVNIQEMMFCEVDVYGYEYYPCGFYGGDYRWGKACVLYCHCEHQCDLLNGVCDGECTSGWKKRVDVAQCSLPCTPGFGDSYCHPCRCLDASGVCNVTTGHCDSGCDDRYIGDGCNVVKPTLRESTITFTEDKDVITATITDIEYRTELVSEYLVQYKLLHEDTFISINVNPISRRRRREDDVVLHIPFSDQSINSQYEFRITPLVSSPEYNDVVGVPSDIILYSSGCLQYTGLPSCNHWCVCSNEPGTLCLLACDYCYACDSEPELPSGKNVNFKITDITSDSMRIQFIDTHSDLPPTLIFLTSLGNRYANISFLSSYTDYTYHNLSPNTEYDIEVTAVLQGGMLSRSWTLTATTLTESSDNTLPVVIGCVVTVTGVVALLVVIGIVLKRRKARPLQEHFEEPYDYIYQISDNEYRSTGQYLTQKQHSEDSYDDIIGVAILHPR